VWGDPEIYQLASIGGTNTLRGFRFDRFYGNTSFYHNNDLRWRIFSSENRVIPFTFGLTGSFDYGRVWLKNEKSDTWHLGYGGGFWVAPIDYIILSTGLYHSKDDNIVIFTLGFAF
jgi:hemolysin activation/secretion protein